MQKNDYRVKDNEKHLYHVRFTKILKDGKRTVDTHVYQPFSKKEYEGLLKTAEELGLGVTQFDEMELVHDPRLVNEAPEPKAVIDAPVPSAARKEVSKPAHQKAQKTDK
jgi:hypothetical protein